ncbi:hypothetical protein HD806DRAFT_119821 [Xylariaceae sp. AK1471]|nr:hypothetical protein HD806DRAFT_119821 [Xylariaceae sp. AK1471]
MSRDRYGGHGKGIVEIQAQMLKSELYLDGSEGSHLVQVLVWLSHTQMLYACSVWSNANIRGKGYTNKTLEMLQAMQARAARVISGAFKATSRPALDIETCLLPAKQQIWKHNAETIGRVLSSQYIPELEEYQV